MGREYGRAKSGRGIDKRRESKCRHLVDKSRPSPKIVGPKRRRPRQECAVYVVLGLIHPT